MAQRPDAPYNGASFAGASVWRVRRHLPCRPASWASPATIATPPSWSPASRSISARPTAPARATGRRRSAAPAACWSTATHPEFWVDPATLDLADIGDFALALGDIPASLRADRAAGGGICAICVALGGEHGITLPLLRALARRLGGTLGAGAFRRPCRYLAGQFRPALRARLGVLPRDRGRPGRSAPDDPDRHPLAGAARR